MSEPRHKDIAAITEKRLYFTAANQIAVDNQTYTPEQIQAGAQVRIANALDYIADNLGALNRALQPQVVGATIAVPGGQNSVVANMKKGSNQVDIQMEFATPEKAVAFFGDFMEHLKNAVDQAEEERKGGQVDG